MEEGELPADYDTALEWPGEELASSQAEDLYDNSYPLDPTKIKAEKHTILRLLVSRTSILPRKQQLVDPADHTELQFGRDVPPPGCDTPRIRLKEMEVSKLHATVYWDKKLQAWGVVDHGSMHGTFVKSEVEGSSSQLILESEKRGMRLSAPRVASIPRTLRHLDLLSIGSTTFLAHVHASRLTCDKCSTGSAKEIPLSIASENTRESTKRSSEAAGFDQGAPVDHKKALKMLKYNLISKQSPHATDPSTMDRPYVDRAARRRVQQPGSTILPPAPSYPQISSSPFRPLKPNPDRLSDMYMPPVSVSAPPSALSNTNVGHRLLQKQGWQPGETLGQMADVPAGERTSLLEPIQVSANIGRAGIGMSQGALSNIPESNAKTSAMQKRWDSVKEGG